VEHPIVDRGIGKARLIAKLFYGYLTNVIHEESDLAKMTLATCHLVMVSHGMAWHGTTEAEISESRVGLDETAREFRCSVSI
jgi:hypothetical protein